MTKEIKKEFPKSKFPVHYNKKIQEYIAQCKDKWAVDPNGKAYKTHTGIPTVYGLADYLGVSKRTLYNWIDKNEGFALAFESFRNYTLKEVIEQGSAGNVSPKISSIMLAHEHGMSDKPDTNVKIEISPIIQEWREREKLQIVQPIQITEAEWSEVEEK